MIVLKDGREHVRSRRGEFVDQNQQWLPVGDLGWRQRQAAGRVERDRSTPAALLVEGPKHFVEVVLQVLDYLRWRIRLPGGIETGREGEQPGGGRTDLEPHCLEGRWNEPLR